MTIYGRRRERLLSAAKGYDTVVVLNPKNLFYLTDFWGGGIGIVREESTVVVTSVMEQKRATESGKEVLVVPEKGMAAIHEAARKRMNGKVLVDAYDPDLRGEIDEALFLGVRRTKDSEEVKRIAKATKKVELLYSLLEREIRPGRTETEIASEVMRLATREGLSPLGAEGSLSPVIVASGPNGALPHAELTERKVGRGDLIVADIFFRFRGYCTDCTRTYAVGKASEDARAGYEAVLEAQKRGVELAVRGAKARAIHAGVTAVLAEHGLERYFTHGTGHGVGIDIHERPSIGMSSDDILAEGDVVTVEPGIYKPGRFGVRIEDTVVIGRETENLYEYTRELQVL